jgi:transposase-like protein/IS1 family transposase
MVCHNCNSEAKRHGKDKNGNQRFRCRTCNRTFAEDRPRPLGSMRIPMEKAVQVLHQLLEGSSIRSTERLTEIDRNTILSLLEHVGEGCQRFLDAKLVGLHVDEVEVDEFWCYVKCKEATRLKKDYGAGCGDAYTFIGIERNTKMIIAWHLGRRTSEDTWAFASKLNRATAGRFQLSTDGYRPYTTAMPRTLGNRIDFMQIIKHYAPDREEGASRKYSPPVVAAISYEYCCGAPKIDRVSTSICERSHLSARMAMRRATRLTNAASKKWANHGYALALWFAYYNFCRRHSTLKQTPAMAMGLADHEWTIRELVEQVANA